MTISDPSAVDEAFADTCVLVSFVQQEFEHNAAVELIETDYVETVMSDGVLEEFNSVTDRREDIYEDLVAFLLAEDGTIGEYDPADRRVYFDDSDRDHVLNIQMSLSQLEDSRQVKQKLRQYVREAGRRVNYLNDKFEDEVVVPPGSIMLELAIARLIGNDPDATVVANAAGWTADGGSGVLVTLDSGDILENEAEIAELLREKKDPDWVLRICRPQDLLPEET